MADEQLILERHVRLVLTAAAFGCLVASVRGQEIPRVQQIETAELRLFPQPFRSSRGAHAEFFVRLPEHVAFPRGSELRLAIEIPTNVLQHAFGVRVSLNEEPVQTMSGRLAAMTQVHAALPPKLLQGGWNKVAVELAYTNSLETARVLAEAGAWGLWGSNTLLTVTYKRMTPFPELARFPHSYTEEKLLQAASSDLVHIFLPSEWRSVHVRALATVGARFGQVDYVTDADLRLRDFASWTDDQAEPNSIVIGSADEVRGMTLPRDLEARRERLGPGEGLLAEWMVGRRRCLLVSGADDVGLEKALLTLGSSPAMTWAPPSPVVVHTTPESRPDLAYLRRPHAGSVSFESLGWSPLLLRGPMREQTLAGWRLPPGYALNGSSRLHLNLITAAGLTNSWLDVLINSLPVRRLELTAEFASLASVRIDLPEGLRGRDPMTLTFRTRLLSDSNAPPWVSVLGSSRLEVRPQRLAGQGLDELAAILSPDPFLNRVAFALPEESSWAELQSFLELMLHVGGTLPSSAILWPEAVLHSETQRPLPERLQNRHVVVLGGAQQWRHAIPPHAPLPVEFVVGNQLVMQGRVYPLSAFEPELALAQLIRSPWDSDMSAVVAGGWRSFTNATRLLARRDAFLFGNVSVLDPNGRATAYDTRDGNNESLAERIQHDLPLGLDPQQTKVHAGIREAFVSYSDRVNSWVWIATLTLLGVLIGARVWFTWEQNQRRRKALANEKPLAA